MNPLLPPRPGEAAGPPAARRIDGRPASELEQLAMLHSCVAAAADVRFYLSVWMVYTHIAIRALLPRTKSSMLFACAIPSKPKRKQIPAAASLMVCPKCRRPARWVLSRIDGRLERGNKRGRSELGSSN